MVAVKRSCPLPNRFIFGWVAREKKAGEGASDSRGDLGVSDWIGGAGTPRDSRPAWLERVHLKANVQEEEAPQERNGASPGGMFPIRQSERLGRARDRLVTPPA